MESMPMFIRRGDDSSLARQPYRKAHEVKTQFLDGDANAKLAGLAYERAPIDIVGDIDTATLWKDELSKVLSPATEFYERLAEAIRSSNLPEMNLKTCLSAVESRVDLLSSKGAAFHNDTFGHWSKCMFWVLALDVQDVELCIPEAGFRRLLRVGDLVVFDPSLAHGLCRPSDKGRFVAKHFDAAAAGAHQAFLTGELELGSADWAALGCPWVEVSAPEFTNATDLLRAEFTTLGAARAPRRKT